mgnify:CR=1 FL=1
MDDVIRAIRDVQDRVRKGQASFDSTAVADRLEKLQQQMAAPTFWSDRGSAEKVSQEAALLERRLATWNGFERQLADMLSVARDDQADTEVNFRTELETELARISKELEHEETLLWLNGRFDTTPAILTIYSGAGGVDAQDWAAMLERMYLKFAEVEGTVATILQRTPGAEAGIKNVTMRIAIPYAYGYLKNEAGVHRLVRISPYDADKARHTSFAMVEVLPEVEDDGGVEIKKDDVRVDVFRSSGHGGQSVNTTDSAVRLTHIPTGITTSCQNERSQMQNKAQAWKMLLGKLAKYYDAQREEERQLLRGEFTENSWGSQIRSYVLHPYKMVKDHRTKFESKNPDAVLAGDIMPFIEAELRRSKD